MKKINLTQGQKAIVDDDDYLRVGHLKWCAQKRPNGRFYALRRTSRTSVEFLHRAVLPVKKGLMIDHKNHDSLDCRKVNLRPCTKKENCRNRDVSQTKSKSGLRGVVWSEIHKKWRASISVNGKMIIIGSFLNKEDAGAAYVKANRKYYGAFSPYT